MYVWYDIVWYIQYDVWRNTAALVPRAVSCIALSCAVKIYAYRPVPSKKQKCTVPCRRKKKVPSLPVVKKVIYRPVQWGRIIHTVPSRRWQFNYIQSRPVAIIFIYRPVQLWQVLFTVPSRRWHFFLPSRLVMKQKGHFTVPSRPVKKIHTHRPVLSHPGNYYFHYFTVPSRPVFNFFPAKHVKAVPSRSVSKITNHEKPWYLPNVFQ